MEYSEAKSPKISVIVPVYNVERYLRRCLDSILKQTFSDFELILVNDGSIDSSLSICREYEAKDSRIVVLNGENQGSSVARNKGLAIAKGEYLIHIDSDDWMEVNMLELLYKKAVESHADIVACNICYDDGKGNRRDALFSYSEEREQFLYLMNALQIAVWNKLVKRNLYEDYDIRFIPGITMCEDLVVTTRLRFHSKKTVIIPEVLYHYFNAPRESICTAFKGKYPESKIKVAHYLDEYLRREFPNRSIVNLTINNLKLVVKREIYESKVIGGAKEWKKIFPESNKYIWRSQFSVKGKCIMTMALLLPSQIFDFLFEWSKNNFRKE